MINLLQLLLSQLDVAGLVGVTQGSSALPAFDLRGDITIRKMMRNRRGKIALQITNADSPAPGLNHSP